MAQEQPDVDPAVNPNPGVLTPVQRERLKVFIPRTFRKLETRDRVHIVALGDSVTRVYTPVAATNEDFIEGYVAKFGGLLAKRFFYPGGVRMVNAPKGRKEKVDEHLGREIQVENLAVGGRTAVDALQFLTTTAFLNDPDLVLVNYGINDAVQAVSLDAYRRSLVQVVKECQSRGVDVIVMAPNLIRMPERKVEWGLTRPYATVAEEVAAEHQVLFMDFGKFTATFGGAVPANYESEAAVTQVTDRLRTLFHFESGQPDDTLHPNHGAQKAMGSALYEQLVNGLGEPSYQVTARARARGEEVVVTLAVKNLTEEERQAHLCALPLGRWLETETPYHSFHLAPGRRTELEIVYKASGSGAGGLNVRTDVGDGLARFSYLISDDTHTELQDSVTRLDPIAVDWVSKAMTDMTDSVQIQWTFMNGTKEALKGNYTFYFGEEKADGTFELPPVGSAQYYVSFDPKFPEKLLRKKYPVRLEVAVNGQKLVYKRELEATRDIALGQRVSLQTQADYEKSKQGETGEAGQNDVSLKVDADENWLYFTAQLAGQVLQEVTDKPEDPPFAVVAELRLDARPTAECRTFGYVDFVRLKSGAADGPGFAERLPVAAFGNGYDQLLDPLGFPTELKSNADGTKRLEFRVPWSYLYRHEKKLGQSDGILGLGLHLRLPSPGEKGVQFLPERTWILNDSGLYPRDARGLVTLRLVEKPDGLLPTWSARLY